MRYFIVLAMFFSILLSPVLSENEFTFQVKDTNLDGKIDFLEINTGVALLELDVSTGTISKYFLENKKFNTQIIPKNEETIGLGSTFNESTPIKYTLKNRVQKGNTIIVTITSNKAIRTFTFFKNKYFFNEKIKPTSSSFNIAFGPFIDNPKRQQLAWYDTKLRTSYFSKALKQDFTIIPSFMSFLSPYYNLTVSFENSKPDSIKIIPANTEKNITEKGIFFKLFLSPEKENSFNIFIGPNDKGLLSEIKADNLISYGFFSSIAQILLNALKFFYRFTHDWGISIILLTFLIKLLLHPLTVKQAHSASEMKKIQPIINNIREKYKGDPNRLNTEMMKVYKDHNVNPLGGCLPVLIQIPILFALFTVLRVSIELKGESFLWIHDLAAPDTTLILPILVALSMYFQQKTMPAVDQNQKTMMAIMPIMMFFFARALAAGVVLYWFVSTLLGAFEQYRVMNKQPSGSNSKL